MGIVFFLFEMGLELSVQRLKAMKRDVFGMGLATFGVTAAAVAGVGYLAGLTGAQMIVIGGGVALSSSAFVLQLLRDRDDLGTRYGRACFGILLFQVRGSAPRPKVLSVCWMGEACLLARGDKAQPLRKAYPLYTWVYILIGFFFGRFSQQMFSKISHPEDGYPSSPTLPPRSTPICISDRPFKLIHGSEYAPGPFKNEQLSNAAVLMSDVDRINVSNLKKQRKVPVFCCLSRQVLFYLIFVRVIVLRVCGGVTPAGGDCSGSRCGPASGGDSSTCRRRRGRSRGADVGGH